MVGHLQIMRYPRADFLPCRNSYGVVATDLEGTRFKRWIAESNAYSQRKIKRFMKLIIDQTISNWVWFLFLDILLSWGIPGGVLWDYTIIFEISPKYFIKVFFFSIWSKNLYEFFDLLFYFMSELFELFKIFRLMVHQIHKPITWVIIDKGYEVDIATPSLYIKWTTHISVHQC